VEKINLEKSHKGENMVKYIEKVDKKISSLKKASFSRKHKEKKII
jgi:hypothetical protein